MKFINSTAKTFWRFLTKKLRLENDSKTVQRSALCRSRRELSNEYLLAKIGVDTAENEPLEVWGKIQFTTHFTPYCSCFRADCATAAKQPRSRANSAASCAGSSAASCAAGCSSQLAKGRPFCRRCFEK